MTGENAGAANLEVDDVEVGGGVLFLEEGGEGAAAHAKDEHTARRGGAEGHYSCRHVAEDWDGEDVGVANHCGGLTHAAHRAEFQAADPSEVVHQNGLAGNGGIVGIAQRRGLNC
jgi:hypothetical protein